MIMKIINKSQDKADAAKMLQCEPTLASLFRSRHLIVGSIDTLKKNDVWKEATLTILPTTKTPEALELLELHIETSSGNAMMLLRVLSIPSSVEAISIPVHQ